MTIAPSCLAAASISSHDEATPEGAAGAAVAPTDSGRLEGVVADGALTPVPQPTATRATKPARSMRSRRNRGSRWIDSEVAGQLPIVYLLLRLARPGSGFPPCAWTHRLCPR